MNKKQEKGFEEKILAGIRECKNEANKKMVFNGYGVLVVSFPDQGFNAFHSSMYRLWCYPE